MQIFSETTFDVGVPYALPLFYWVVTLGKLFTGIDSPSLLSSKKLGYKRKPSGRANLMA